MRKIASIFIAFVFLVAIIPKSVSADFATAYQDYVFNLQNYKNAYNEYQVAKSAYQTYGTLTAQNDAIVKFKAVLKARNQVMSTYYDLLQEKLNATTGVSDDTKKTFTGIRQSEKQWLSSNQATIDAAGDLDDLNSLSDEFKKQYEQMDEETKQTVGAILIAKEGALRNKLNTDIAGVTTKLGEIRNQGENTTAAERGIITIQTKLDFQNQKAEKAQTILSGKDLKRNQKIDLLAGQKSLIEANQYLKEAASYLLEIVRSYTG